MRPLAPQVGWVWVFAIGFLAFYFLIGALFPRPVLACVNELTGRPATTFLMGVLTTILFLPVLAILSATGVGLLVAPFLLAALVIGAIVGKVGLLETIIDPVAAALRTAPIEDEPVSEEEERAVNEAKQWLQENSGKGIPHEEVLADLGLSMDDFRRMGEERAQRRRG